MIVGLNGDHQGNRDKSHIHVDVLLFAVIQQTEILRLEAADVLALAIQNGNRRQHDIDADLDGLVRDFLSRYRDATCGTQQEGKCKSDG